MKKKELLALEADNEIKLKVSKKIQSHLIKGSFASSLRFANKRTKNRSKAF